MWWLWHTGGGKWWNGSPPPEALHLIALHLFPFHCKVLVILIQMLTNTSVKEVQTTLPLTFYRCIFEKIDSQYRKHFWAVLLSAPPQGYTYIDEYSRLLHWNLTISKPKWKSSNFKKLPKEGDFLQFALLCENSSWSWYHQFPNKAACDSMLTRLATCSAVHLRQSTASHLNVHCPVDWNHSSWLFQLLLFIPSSPSTPYFSIQ